MVLLGHQRNRRSAARFQESREQCAGGKARTVNWCEQANALIDSEDPIPLPYEMLIRTWPYHNKGV
jgi:hypothetical protein